MTHQKGANLLQYNVEKQVFSWRDWKQKKCSFDALLRFVAGFFTTHKKTLIFDA